VTFCWGKKPQQTPFQVAGEPPPPSFASPEMHLPLCWSLCPFCFFFQGSSCKRRRCLFFWFSVFFSQGLFLVVPPPKQNPHSGDPATDPPFCFFLGLVPPPPPPFYFFPFLARRSATRSFAPTRASAEKPPRCSGSTVLGFFPGRSTASASFLPQGFPFPPLSPLTLRPPLLP